MKNVFAAHMKAKFADHLLKDRILQNPGLGFADLELGPLGLRGLADFGLGPLGRRGLAELGLEEHGLG